MRVDDGQVTGNPAAQSTQASAPLEVERRGDSRPLDSRWGGGADRVELSKLTGGLACALQASATGQADRVEQLGRDIADGRYRLDPVAVSRAIVAEMLAAGCCQSAN